MKNFFVKCDDVSGIFCFYHNLFRDAVCNYSIKEQAELLQNIKQYFLKQDCYYKRPEATWLRGIPNERKVQELIPVLMKTNDLGVLRECLCNNDFCYMYILANKLNELFYYLSEIPLDEDVKLSEKQVQLKRLIQYQYKTIEFDEKSFWPLLHEYHINIGRDIPSIWLEWREIEQGTQRVQIEELLVDSQLKMSLSENGILVGIYRNRIRLYDLKLDIPLNIMYFFDKVVIGTEWLGNILYVLTQKQFYILEFIKERISLLYVYDISITNVEKFSVCQDGKYVVIYKKNCDSVQVINLEENKSEIVVLPSKSKKKIECTWIIDKHILVVYIQKYIWLWSTENKNWKCGKCRCKCEDGLCASSNNENIVVYWLCEYCLVSYDITKNKKRHYEFRFPGCKEIYIRINLQYSVVVTDKRNIDVFYTKTGILAAQILTEYNIEHILFSESGEKILLIYTKNRVEMIDILDYVFDSPKRLMKKRRSLIDMAWRKRYFLEKYIFSFQNNDYFDLMEEKAKFVEYSYAQQAVVNIAGDYVALYFPDAGRIRIIRLSTQKEIAYFLVQEFKLKELLLPCMLGNNNGEYLMLCYSKSFRVLRISDLKWVYRYELKKQEIKEVYWENNSTLILKLNSGSYERHNIYSGKMSIEKNFDFRGIQESEMIKVYKKRKQNRYLLQANSESDKKNKMKYLYYAELALKENIVQTQGCVVYIDRTDNMIHIMNKEMDGVYYSRNLEHNILAADVHNGKIILVSDESPYILETEIWSNL